MEARTAIRGSGISRSLVAVCAVVATMGLGVTAGVVAKNLSVPAAVPAHIVSGQGGMLQYSGHRGGVQTIDNGLLPAYQQVDTRGVQAGPAAVGPDDRPTAQLAPNSFLGPDAQERNAQLAPNSFLGPDAQERNAQLAAPARTTKANGYI